MKEPQEYSFFTRYRAGPEKPLSPENQEILRRWLARALAERKRRFPQFYKD